MSEAIYWAWRDRPKERRAEWPVFCEYRARERQAEVAYPDTREGFAGDE